MQKFCLVSQFAGSLSLATPLFQNLQQSRTDENTETLPSTSSKLEATTEDSLDLEVSINLSKENESTQLADSTSVMLSPTALSIDLPSKKYKNKTLD